MNRQIGWLDCSMGVAGDMLLAALTGAGVRPETVTRAVAALGLPVRVTFEGCTRGGLAARRAVVSTADEPQPPRTYRDLVDILGRAALAPDVRDFALQVFGLLASAEATVHGSTVDEVHFHEVGALDALADVVGCAAGFRELALDQLVVSPIALGSGRADTAHGSLPVPVPAVLELLRPTHLVVTGGDQQVELCTPTGAALLAAVATGSGPMPPMSIDATGVGAGRRDLAGAANVVRLVVGATTDYPTGAHPATLISTNVDDLDPRLWPAVLERLLDLGASDAWLTPILMKKGRPAHTLSVLSHADLSEEVRRVVFEETSAIGLREQPVTKWALARSEHEVQLEGGAVRIKVAHLDGAVVNLQPEYEDVATVARASGRPVKVVLAEALRAGAEALGAAGTDDA